VIRRFSFGGKIEARLTHYAFRYPAKFHPPVARALVETYVPAGGRVLDPFCGSGSLLVEALAEGCFATGYDIDPVAVFVAKAKTHRYDVGRLLRSCELFLGQLQSHCRPDHEYFLRQFDDLSDQTLTKTLRKNRLWVPAIPNLKHWFRNYVIVDLANIWQVVEGIAIPEPDRMFLKLCFASIIRASSNADPVPVSGLEVTAHMLEKDGNGRIIHPFQLIERAVEQTLLSVIEFASLTSNKTSAQVFQADATRLRRGSRVGADAVITSPPYHNAVDYHRRHQLEMYWLRLISDHTERLSLVSKYVGRPGGRMRHPFVTGAAMRSDLAVKWERRIQSYSPNRAADFKHYVIAMEKSLTCIASWLPSGSNCVLVVGKSTWNGVKIPTTSLLGEISWPLFKVTEELWYPIPNRYMSYSRHNGASIDREHVLVLRRK
jgi:hypothetical protein